jgi:DNA-binding CsgD family transcriptional regulator/tetratricopeptide (TPR) repeat protein
VRRRWWRRSTHACFLTVMPQTFIEYLGFAPTLLRSQRGHTDVMPYQVITGRFVGRTQELALLRELLAHATTGTPLVAVIGGEAGVGKTRLVDQLAATATQQGARVLRGGCVPLGEEGVPFAPVVEALRGLAGELDPAALEAVAGPARADLGRLLPDLAWSTDAAAAGAGVAGAGAAGAGVGGASQGRLFELLLGVVQRLAASAPLLLVMEDLHWADRSTRDLVAYLAAALRSGRVMVALTFRSDELDRRHPLRGLLGELARNRRARRLELARFTRAELAEQLGGLLGTDPPAGLVDDIHARSEGNPFFAEELVLAGTGDGAGPGALPPSLQEILLTRVVRLGHRTQRVLGVAAAAGPGVTQPVLAAVARMDEAALLDSLHEAVDQQVLFPEPGGDGYVFRHALVAEAVYGELLPGERVRLHTALASTLEADVGAGGPPAARAARIAHHWSQAGDQPRALTASIEAAAAAEQVYAFAEAQLQLERVLELWDRVPDAAARAGMDRPLLLSRCAEATEAAGDTARAAQLVRQAVALVDETRHPQRLGLLHEQLARYLRWLGDPAALGEQQEAMRLVLPEPSFKRARVLGSLAQHLMLVDRFEEAKGPAEEAVAIAGQVGAPAEEANARTALGHALVNLGDADAGLAELEAAVRLATKAGDVIVALRAIVNHSDGLLAAGRLEEAATVALDGIEEARRLGLARSFGPLLACNATDALVALGHWDDAERVSREGLEIAPSDAATVNLPLARVALELGLGDLDAAEARLQAVRRLLPNPIPEAQKSGPLFTGLAEVALWRGDLERARELVAQAVPLVEVNPRHAAPLYALGMRVEADRAELARARRPAETAADRAESAKAHRQGKPASDDTAAALLERLQEAAAGPAAAGLPELAAWRATALAERTRHDGQPDPAAWATAAALWERRGQPYRVAYACFRQAEALMAGNGDRDTAAEALRRAAAITGRLGARPLDTEVKALARRARLDLGPHAVTPAPAADTPTPAEDLGLTPREAEVLALVAAGRSNRQIAQALFISPKTASVHVSNILAKLGVASRVEAAAVAHRLGLDRD